MNPIYLEPNQQEELQEKYVTEVIERSLGYISAHYEHPEDPRARLDYHNTAHTLEDVYKRQIQAPSTARDSLYESSELSKFPPVSEMTIR